MSYQLSDFLHPFLQNEEHSLIITEEYGEDFNSGPSKTSIFPSNDRSSSSCRWKLTSDSHGDFFLTLISFSFGDRFVKATFNVCQSHLRHRIKMSVKEGYARFEIGRQVKILLKSDLDPNFEAHLSIIAHIHSCSMESSGLSYLRALTNDKYSDMVVKVKSDEIPAHRIVLDAHSSVFSAMLEQEEDRGYIEIEDFDTNIVEVAISFMYSGRQPDVNDETALQLLKFSDKYDIFNLKQICEWYFVLELTEQNLMEILQMADTYHSKVIRENSISFIHENLHNFNTTTIENVISWFFERPDVTRNFVYRLVEELQKLRRNVNA